MAHILYATKLNTTQTWDQNDHRLPVTIIVTNPYIISQVKTIKTDGYAAIQVAFGQSKKAKTKPVSGHLKPSKAQETKHLKEIRFKSDEQASEYKVGQELNPLTFFEVGDQVKAVGVSKGHGFTGVMKRWGFSGGPRTHGQSDRERAPGSIGQGTTPGRVYKGKKMAGRHGNQQNTVKNLVVVNIDAEANQIWLKGTLPGPTGSLIQLEKTGTTKFPGLITTKDTQPETQAKPSDSKSDEPTSEKTPSDENKKTDSQPNSNEPNQQTKEASKETQNK